MIEATLCHAAALAAIHATAFPAAARWDARAMVELLAMPGAFGFIDPRGGCAVARLAGGEAELLTLAVSPGVRRQGIGSALLRCVLEAVGEAVLFLEVACDNLPALALYAAAGLQPCGRRPGYYGEGRDALLLRH